MLDEVNKSRVNPEDASIAAMMRGTSIGRDVEVGCDWGLDELMAAMEAEEIERLRIGSGDDHERIWI